MGKKILVIDDEDVVRQMLLLRLQSAGYEVVLAANGLEGLEKAKSERPDMAISDVLMPVMDGFGFFKSMKADPELAHIPIMMLTARGATKVAFEAFEVDAFVSKPFDGAKLVEQVTSILSRT